MVLTLLVDNYDSFTYNLFQLLAQVNGREPIVLRNDDVDGWRALDWARIDNIVISPGPGRPERPRDFGLSTRALEHGELPLLGVCLGLQGLCHHHGGRIGHAPAPMHGRRSAVHHAGGGLFAGIPSPFEAVRYHSLAAVGVPEPLEVVATADDGVVMAVRHRRQPHWGVQFHPESIRSEHGRRLLENFRGLTLAGRAPRAAASARRRTGDGVPAGPRGDGRYEVLVRAVPGVGGAERAHDALTRGARVHAWLDSSSAADGRSRFSIVCLPGPDLGEVVSYRVGARRVTVTRPDGTPVAQHDGTLFDYLERELERRRVPDPALPCEFALGYVGYLGYELKADCGGAAAHTSTEPDAVLAFCDRALVVDHRTGGGWLLALATPSTRAAALAWLDGAGRALRVAAAAGPCPLPGPDHAVDAPPLEHALRHPPAAYRALIEQCLQALRDGESYELCLTNMVTAPFEADPMLAYRVLRRVNPAPYAALLRFGRLDVLSSSPERFVAIDRHGVVESMPIKGTRGRSPDGIEDARRARELAASEKDRAENLMIVDLLRNDLGSVSEVGSVTVPRLFEVQSFASLHQLVSTIRARLRPDVPAVRCVQALFPGGSMTGAPKLRTMEILDALEGGPRGVYSGALGYFSLNGAVDLSIVIRTAVVSGRRATIGAGGAIVALSDPDAEVDEALLKARPVLRALAIAEAAARTSPLDGPRPALHGTR